MTDHPPHNPGRCTPTDPTYTRLLTEGKAQPMTSQQTLKEVTRHVNPPRTLGFLANAQAATPGSGRISAEVDWVIHVPTN